MEYSAAGIAFQATEAESALLKSLEAMFPEKMGFEVDRRLCAAARDHSADLATLKSLPKKLNSGRLRPLLWKYGVAEFQFVPISVAIKDVKADSGVLSSYVRSAASEGYMVCGAGMAGRDGNRGAVATVICLRKIAEVDSFSRSVGIGSTMPLKGRLVPGYARPRVYVSQPSGLVSKIEPALSGGEFSATMKFPVSGKYLVELMVTGKTGPEIAALAPVYAEMQSEEILSDIMAPLAADDPTKGITAVDAEKSLQESISRERKKLDLTSLAQDEALTRLAREKSKAMAGKKQFGHNLSKASLDESLKSASISFAIAGENIAVDSSPKMGHYMFMNSPAHRANILNPAMTHYGIGVEKIPDSDEYYITEIFVRKDSAQADSQSVQFQMPQKSQGQTQTQAPTQTPIPAQTPPPMPVPTQSSGQSAQPPVKK
jgi:uncharacterized protein YkwD